MLRHGNLVNDGIGYDANGNVAAITDAAEGITSRTLGYDGLDRLTSAAAPSLWGNASFGYDSLDNLTTSVVGSRSSTHAYNAGTNRLTSITNHPYN